MPSTGAKLPTAAQTISENPYDDDTWVNPTNIYGAGEASVTAPTFDAGDYTYVLKAYTFDFSSIPAGSTINGVKVVINSRYANAPASIYLVQLLDTARAKVGTNKGGPTSVTTTATDYTFGGIADTWGNALTTTWVQNSNFGVAVVMRADGTGNNNVDVFIDYVTMEINYATPIVTADGNNTQDAGAVTISGLLQLVSSDASQTQETDSLLLINKTSLTISDGNQVQTADEANPGIIHALAVDDASHVHEADGLTIELVTEAVTLSIDDVSQDQHSASNDITWIYLLDQDGIPILDLDGNPILVETDDLFLVIAGAGVVADANQAQAADDIEISGNKYILVDDANQSSAVTDVTFPGGFLDQRHAIILGLNSAQSELTGWNNVVRDTLPDSAVVRTSDTVVTITLPAEVAYAITAQETITATIPDSALVGTPDLVATPTFTIDVTASALINDANQVHVADTIELASVLELSSSDQAQTADDLTLVRLVSLPVDSCNHTQTTDSLTLNAKTALTVADANQTQDALSSDTSVISVTVYPDEVTQAQTADDLLIGTVINVGPNVSLQSQESDNVEFTNVTSLTVQDADQTQSADNITANIHTSIVLEDANQTHTAEEITALNTAMNVVSQSADQGQATDALTLTVKHALAVQDGVQVQVSDGIDLTSITSISVDDVNQAQAYAPLPIVFYVIPELQDASHDQIADDISVLIRTSLLVNDANHTQTATNITDIGTVGVFNAFYGIQAQTADSVTLVLLPRFTVNNALQGQYADNVPLYVDIYTPSISHIPCGHWHTNVTHNPVWAFVPQPEKPHYNEATSISSRTNPVWIFTKQENKL